MENEKLRGSHVISRIFYFYLDGFRSMTTGKTLWTIILIKLFIIFFILKLFFFPDFLNTRYDNDDERAAHVAEELTSVPTGQTPF